MAFYSNIWNKACSIFRLGENDPQANELLSDEDVLQQAYQELQQAQNWFSHLDEPEMVECAIFRIKAAEQHYDYLLRRIKAKSRSKDEFIGL